jgi:DNA-binding FadR family transcriptional regulator
MVIVALFASEGDGTKGTVGSGSDGIGGIRGLNCSEHWNNAQEMSGALPRTSLPDQVFHRLVSDVLAGRYAPGERLPTQRALAAELAVNMASVREGVKRLEQLGLVEVRHGDAMRVLDWRLHGGPDVLVHLIAHAGAIDVEMVSSVMEARRLLLSESARLAAARRTDEQAALLASLAEQLASAEDGDAAQHLDFAFFAVLIQAAGNVVFLLVMNSIRALYLENLELFRPLVSTGDAYAAAARAVADGDADAAAATIAQLAAAQEARLLP